MKRIIIKIGTKVLTGKDGKLDNNIIKNIVEQVVSLRGIGYEVILVTSGAVGSGRALMNPGHKNETLSDKQVYAAVGQVEIMNTYAKYLKKHNLLSAQILVTKEDFRDRVHYQNMETCFRNILSGNVVPIVNENDVVAVKELIFTDNDELASLVALQLNVDTVFMLSSIEGLVAGDFAAPGAKAIPEVRIEDMRSLEKFVTSNKSGAGRGGMLTKFAMARKLISAGITVYVLNGKRRDGVVDIVAGEKIGTRFVPQKKISSRKRRIAHGDSLARGTIVINKCVEDQILEGGKTMSILPIGVLSADGEFKKGDIVKIVTKTGRVIGCGISKFDMEQVAQNAGVKGGRAVIHYDDLFVY